MLLPEPTGGQ